MIHIATAVKLAKAMMAEPTPSRAHLVCRAIAQIVCQARDVDNDVGEAHTLLGKTHQFLYPGN